MKMLKKKKLSPKQANKFQDICRLKTDNRSLKGYWIIIDERNVTIAKQKNGEPADKIINIPRRQFNALIEWHSKQQPITP